MKIYKVKQMSGVEVVLVGREALDALMDAANKGARLVMTKYGVINPSSIDSITLHRDLMGSVADQMRYGKTLDQATAEVLGSLPTIEESNAKALPQKS